MTQRGILFSEGTVFQLLDFVPDVPVLQIFKLQPNSNT